MTKKLLSKGNQNVKNLKGGDMSNSNKGKIIETPKNEVEEIKTKNAGLVIEEKQKPTDEPKNSFAKYGEANNTQIGDAIVHKIVIPFNTDANKRALLENGINIGGGKKFNLKDDLNIKKFKLKASKISVLSLDIQLRNLINAFTTYINMNSTTNPFIKNIEIQNDGAKQVKLVATLNNKFVNLINNKKLINNEISVLGGIITDKNVPIEQIINYTAIPSEAKKFINENEEIILNDNGIKICLSLENIIKYSFLKTILIHTDESTVNLDVISNLIEISERIIIDNGYVNLALKINSNHPDAKNVYVSIQQDLIATGSLSFTEQDIIEKYNEMINERGVISDKDTELLFTYKTNILSSDERITNKLFKESQNFIKYPIIVLKNDSIFREADKTSSFVDMFSGKITTVLKTRELANLINSDILGNNELYLGKDENNSDIIIPNIYLLLSALVINNDKFIINGLSTKDNSIAMSFRMAN